ncbi:creatininase family protein [Alicyclobacillus macrosporangiidus]|uniref:creatininase family protein n=1 Tax=Alicyclobacillus macrosporangiidus TaxID=392015 RepID=UPI00068DE142|nr:creatininase family protein [Alicyclobacillus macrosporangiidus]
MPFFKFIELTRKKIAEIAGESLFVLPVAATEQHGPHLPVGVDTFTVTAIAESACRLAGDSRSVVLAPTLPFGNSHYHFDHGPAMSLSISTFQRVLYDLLDSACRCGFKRLFILNGHGGNDECIRIAVREVVMSHDVAAAAASYWTIAEERLTKEGLVPQSGNLPGHAGEFETSIMLCLHPELVDGRPEVRVEAPTRYSLSPWKLFVQRSHLQVGVDGYTDDARHATADYGEKILRVIQEEVASILRRDF